ncbi:sucrose-phosphate synthase [Trifolium repens]|nr:sucrose-phosphate synthase [Trifolium repens]WJX49824.1 sucrose-phosphate synthase [Trifolium repens]
MCNNLVMHPKKNITTLLKAFGEYRSLRELANLPQRKKEGKKRTSGCAFSATFVARITQFALGLLRLGFIIVFLSFCDCGIHGWSCNY